MFSKNTKYGVADEVAVGSISGFYVMDLNFFFILMMWILYYFLFYNIERGLDYHLEKRS